MLSVSLAISAGFCAAIASLCAKLAFSPEQVFQGVCNAVGFWIVESSTHYDKVVLFSRIVLFVLTFLFNGLMWTLFVKSLRNSPSAQAVITNSASNFISSVSKVIFVHLSPPPPPLQIFKIDPSVFQALFGKFFFGEILSLQWWFGASLIILGLYIINKNKSADDASIAKDKKDY